MSENFDISCKTFAIIFVKLATQTIFKSASLELKDRKVSDPKVMLKLEFAKKKSLRLKPIKFGIGHPPVQTPMLDENITNLYLKKFGDLSTSSLKVYFYTMYDDMFSQRHPVDFYKMFKVIFIQNGSNCSCG